MALSCAPRGVREHSRARLTPHSLRMVQGRAMTPDETIDETLSNHLREASNDPTNEALWDAAENMARTLQRPEEVEALYLDVLGRPLAPEAIPSLSQRAVAFHDEWSADSE